MGASAACVTCMWGLLAANVFVRPVGAALARLATALFALYIQVLGLGICHCSSRFPCRVLVTWRLNLDGCCASSIMGPSGVVYLGVAKS